LVDVRELGGCDSGRRALRKIDDIKRLVVRAASNGGGRGLRPQTVQFRNRGRLVRRRE
jgi:hypothetical protein